MSVTKQLPSLNGLRAVSILLVIISHYVLKYMTVHHIPFDETLVSFHLGQLGVNVFFVISGFLITTLLLREESTQGSIGLKNFYIRRTIRIFPAYYVVLIVYFFLQLLHVITIPGTSWITAITYTKYLNWYKDPYTNHFWSLSVEEHFYLLWPLVFKFLQKHRTKIAASVVILVPIIRFVMGHKSFLWLNHMTLFERADAIMWGCLVAIYQKQILNFIRQKKFVVYLSWFIIVFSLFTPLLTGKLESDLPFRITSSLFGSYGMFPDIAVTIIMLSSVYNSNNSWFAILNTSVFDYTGKISYSIYLWQQFFIIGMVGTVTEAPYNLFGFVLAALISYNLIELPFLRLKKRFESNRAKQPVTYSQPDKVA
jgi:peptidoglycan/LPS O-acetylase OafA/YrhL